MITSVLKFPLWRRNNNADFFIGILCPSADFAPGQRTGKFRLGEDSLLSLPGGESKISMEDFAIAMVDELEKPKHIRERFTVGY